jgi:isopenicillin-N epimerase
VIDHVTSPSAVVLPVARLTAACHAAGAPVLIDGAHAPAMLDVDVAALGAEYYTGNCHKWLMAPKGAGFLHVRRDRQQGLHPLAISHGYRQGFLAEFDWTGTTDFSAFLAVPDAIAFHERLGGLLVRDRNAALAASAAVRLAARLGTETGAPRTQPASMAVVRLPVDPALAAPEAAARLAELREAVLAAGTDAPLHAMAGAVWLRLSAAAYNDLSDYDRLADVLAAALEGYHTGV